MNQRQLAMAAVALVLAIGVAHAAAAADQWTKTPIKGLLPGGKESQEETTLAGTVVAREEKDKNGNAITSAFLEQDDGSLIPLPCTPKQDKGIAAKAAGKVAGDQSCWKYVGQKVEIVWTAQLITKETKRIRRLAKITGIKPL